MGTKSGLSRLLAPGFSRQAACACVKKLLEARSLVPLQSLPDNKIWHQSSDSTHRENKMRLVSYATKDGGSHLGALTEDRIVDLAVVARELSLPSDVFASMASWLEAGVPWLVDPAKLKSIAATSARKRSDVRLLPPIPRPGKIVAIGLNYKDHSMESGAAAPPKSPIIFAKFTTSIAGPEDSIVIPVGNPNVDYEAELAVVIGRRGKAIPRAQAFEYVAGYMPLNDVSARVWQFGDKQWVRGKSCDTFCPTGPHLTTRDEIPDPHALAIRARVNGVTMQDSHTSKMIFRVPELIEFASASITLEPGDIIATGTPEGVGAFRKPPVFLKPGDVVEVEIDRLGVLRNHVVAAGG
jgi:2-keto-4-pentenoate hydratase/2-oxohepta-3-ene-1,7-dioic acid hydratase in catechol pathway